MRSMKACGSRGRNKPERSRLLRITPARSRPTCCAAGGPPRKSTTAIGIGLRLPSSTLTCTCACAGAASAAAMTSTMAARIFLINIAALSLPYTECDFLIPPEIEVLSNDRILRESVDRVARQHRPERAIDGFVHDRIERVIGGRHHARLTVQAAVAIESDRHHDNQPLGIGHVGDGAPAAIELLTGDRSDARFQRCDLRCAEACASPI